MKHYKLTIFGKLDSVEAFDRILAQLQAEPAAEDRARAFAAKVEDNGGEIWFERTMNYDSPYDILKPHLLAANLGWKEMVADEEYNFYQAEISTPEDREVVVVDLVDGEPVIDLPSLLQAKDDGPAALEKLLNTAEKSSLYGQDLVLTLSDDLLDRYLYTLETTSLSP